MGCRCRSIPPVLTTLVHCTAPFHGGSHSNLYLRGYCDGTCSAGEFIIHTFSAHNCSRHQSLTERELLVLHAEIKALQHQHGLSYKDAAHRLYHSEVQKLRVEDEACKAISGLRQQVDMLITDDISSQITSIDEDG
jgi:hypothetical protein